MKYSKVTVLLLVSLCAIMVTAQDEGDIGQGDIGQGDYGDPQDPYGADLGDLDDDIDDEEDDDIGTIEDEDIEDIDIQQVGEEEAVVSVRFRFCKECQNGGKHNRWKRCRCPKGYGGRCCQRKKGKYDSYKEEGIDEKERRTLDLDEEDLDEERRGWFYKRCKKCLNGGSKNFWSGKCKCAKGFEGKCCEKEITDVKGRGLEEEEEYIDPVERSWFNYKCRKCHNGSTRNEDGSCKCTSKYRGRCCVWRKRGRDADDYEGEDITP